MVLPTNWPAEAHRMPTNVIPTRSMENRINYLASDRVGEERGCTFLGRSIITNHIGDPLAEGSGDQEEILYADLDMEAPRQKHIVYVEGEYELDRLNDRRPDQYGKLSE